MSRQFQSGIRRHIPVASSLAITASSLARGLLLGASRSSVLRNLASANGLKFGAARFVAGETIDEFVPIARRLNADGFSIASAILGEEVVERPQTSGVAREYVGLLSRIHAEGLNANVALKLTHLGLSIDADLAAGNLRVIVDSAAGVGNVVRIDMEDSRCVEQTLQIYRGLRSDGFDNVGAVLQAYLYRTLDDLRSLLPLRPNLRLVKGAYLEPPSVAFPRKADVDANYRRLIEEALQGDGYTAIATHDESAIRHALSFASAHGIAQSRFEFQMLYGVRPALQRKLRSEGVPVRIAAPFGREWYPYFMRRLAERPANVSFLLSSLIRG
jgi:proline dehydrogenase